MVRNAIALAAEEGKVRPLKTTPPVLVGRQGTERARWLEPYGEEDWRTEMWGQIVALYGRYPKRSAHSKTAGGPMMHKQRPSACWPSGEPNPTTPV